MIEHIGGALRGSAKAYEGERELPANERQLGFQTFVKKGSVLKHRPSDKTKADLPELRFASLEEAKTKLNQAVSLFFAFRDANPDYVPYAPFMGELSFDEFENFHFMHIKYHLWQFGLLDEYP